MERDKRKKSKMPCLFGGKGENFNRKTVQPRSQSDNITEHNLFMFEGDQTSSKQGYGTPMKTLLAKEMINETSAKKRSPSLIAKLMGLDGLPSPQPLHRQQKKLSENKRNEKPPCHQSNKKPTIEQHQQFKDVYVDPEASHAGNYSYSSPLNPKRRSTKQEMGYIQERCDEMLRESIAIKSKLERVDSNSDLMLTFLQKPDSLFQKHLHDQQGILPPGSLCNQITLLKPSISVISNSKTEQKETLNYRHRRSSRVLERKDDIALSPTRIVVLKPNLAKIDKTSPEMYKGALGEVRSSRHKSREAREIARQITSQMKEGFECGNRMLFHSGFRGYEYDDVDDFDRPRRSPMSESSVIREAKKRMSQRWKTHRYKDAGVVGNGKGSISTLEEMLSVPNSEMRHDDDIINGEYLRTPLRPRSRSRSVPPSFNNQSQKTSVYHEAHGDLKMVVHNEPVHRLKNKGVKGNFNHREDSRSKNLRYPKRCNACTPEFDGYLPERHCARKPTEQESLVSSATVIEQDVGSSAVDEDSLISQEQWSGKSGGTVSIQLSGPEQESSEGSKEVDQFGQMSSVVEVSPTDDVSSGSDCFEGVSTRLLELRKQLLLLKMESESTYDSETEQETEQQQQSSLTLSESENWESIYLKDFLQGSGFYDHDTHTFMTTWYNSQEHPQDPWLFDYLEKKYSEVSSVSRSERKLFYDRITEAIFVISKSRVSCLWVRGIQMTLTETGFEDQLQKVVGKQEKEAMEDFEETCIDKDLDWFRAVDEIDVVGKRIAEMFVNDLVLEIVTL